MNVARAVGQTVTITRASADASLDKLIEEFGEDYVYVTPEGEPSCVNITYVNGEPEGSCLIGRVLLDHGFTPEEMVDCNCRSASFNSIVYALYLPLNIESDVVSYLVRIQSNQDNGNSWGASVQEARAMYRVEEES